MSFYGASLVPGGIHSIAKSERERIKDYAIQGQIHNPKKCRRPNAWNQFIHEYWRDHKDEYKNLADGKYIKDGLNQLFQDASNEYKALTPVQKQEYAKKARENNRRGGPRGRERKGRPLPPPLIRRERKEEKEGKNTPPPPSPAFSPYDEFIQETEEEKKLDEEEGVTGVSPEVFPGEPIYQRYQELLHQTEREQMENERLQREREELQRQIREAQVDRDIADREAELKEEDTQELRLQLEQDQKALEQLRRNNVLLRNQNQSIVVRKSKKRKPVSGNARFFTEFVPHLEQRYDPVRRRALAEERAFRKRLRQ